MAASNQDHTNLDAVAYGGSVREDVMNKIWDISRIPLPLTDRIGTGTHTNRRVEFMTDDLGSPLTDNAHIDGVDVDQNDAAMGDRVGNYTQTALREVQVSHLAQAANSIGSMGKMNYQIMQNQRRLKRDIEAQMLTNQASVAGDGTTTAGISAGLGAWIETNTIFGTGGSAGGFNTTTGVIDAPTVGTALPLTEQGLRDMVQAVYEAGGDADAGLLCMARPPVIRKLSEYLFSTGARIATMTNDNASGTSPMTAYGSANVFVTDFGVLTLVPNRLQPAEDTDVSALFILDPSHLRLSYMRGMRVEPLAKTGLSEKRLMSCDYSLLCLNEKTQAAIHAIDETAAVLEVPA